MQSHEILQKAVLYKAKHRGSKELDLILGGFVDHVINTLSLEDLQHLFHLLEQDDMYILHLLHETSSENNKVVTSLRQYLQSI